MSRTLPHLTAFEGKEEHLAFLDSYDADADIEALSDDYDLKPHFRSRRWVANFKTVFLGLLFGFLAVLEFVLLYKGEPICLGWKEDMSDVLLYSPAQDVVEYELRKHYSNVGENDISPFWKPLSPELDQQWEDLYSFGISKIPKSQAALLPNKTAPIPGDENNYIIELDVFHELHCLNMIRQSLYPDRYPHMSLSNPNMTWHIGHCLDSIRQSLMCSADISVLVWQWSEKFQKTVEHGNVTHTCRKFEKIQDWAKERRLETHFDTKPHLEDDIVIPVYY